MRISSARRTAELTALNTSLANAYIRVYSGTRPATADTALSGNTLLAELRGGATFGTIAGNVTLTANAITADSSADASGTASFVRVLRSDGTTAEFDLSVSATGGGGEAQFANVVFTATEPVSLTSMAITYGDGT